MYCIHHKKFLHKRFVQRLRWHNQLLFCHTRQDTCIFNGSSTNMQCIQFVWQNSKSGGKKKAKSRSWFVYFNMYFRLRWFNKLPIECMSTKLHFKHINDHINIYTAHSNLKLLIINKTKLWWNEFGILEWNLNITKLTLSIMNFQMEIQCLYFVCSSLSHIKLNQFNRLYRRNCYLGQFYWEKCMNPNKYTRKAKTMEIVYFLAEPHFRLVHQN